MNLQKEFNNFHSFFLALSSLVSGLMVQCLCRFFFFFLLFFQSVLSAVQRAFIRPGIYLIGYNILLCTVGSMFRDLLLKVLKMVST